MGENIKEKLEEVFGSYKAEWLKKDIFKFFTEPSYFPMLKGNYPWVLQGGRGTGKTTVLRGLSYVGQYEIMHSDISAFDENTFIGIYYRANTNHVRAFDGNGIDKKTWQGMFEHYFNLVICWEILNFLKWHQNIQNDDETLSVEACRKIATSLVLENDVTDYHQLLHIVENAIYQFQIKVNNVNKETIPHLSMAGVPIEIITKETLQLSQFKGKTYYLLIDEYENFTDEQQECVNTLIKHVPDSYTIKIGVRDMGWRNKSTHNELESLNEPADYRLTNIEKEFNEHESKFEDFAANVCNLRLKQLFVDETEKQDFNIQNALNSISIEDEASKLKVTDTDMYNAFIEVENSMSEPLNVSPLYKYMIAFWAETHDMSIDMAIKDYLTDSRKWDTRYSNYNYSLLFKINRGKFRQYQKYYAGWKTFLKLADGNIRYLMELVYQAYSAHLDIDTINNPVSIEAQTFAAKRVGSKNLAELEGSCQIGWQLTKLVQSLGTIFERLAKDGDINAPEVDQFDLEGEISDEVKRLLDLGVMNLALVRMATNKMSGLKAVKDFQYQLHPIFAPYFGYSFRKKRKMTLKESDILGCIQTPNDTVAEILKRRKVNVEEEIRGAGQLTLFDNENFIIEDEN